MGVPVGISRPLVVVEVGDCGQEANGGPGQHAIARGTPAVEDQKSDRPDEEALECREASNDGDDERTGERRRRQRGPLWEEQGKTNRQYGEITGQLKPK